MLLWQRERRPPWRWRIHPPTATDTELPLPSPPPPAVVYLLPHETSYVDFLRVRKVPLAEAPAPRAPPPDLAPALRRQAESDRCVCGVAGVG